MSRILVFVNERATSVLASATVAEAVDTVDPEAADAVRARRAYVTDGVGRPIEADASLVSGSILRVVRSAPVRRTPESHA